MPARWIAVGGSLAAIAAVVIGGWWFFIRGDEPPPVSLADAVASIAATASPTATGTAASGEASATSTATSTDPASTAGENLDGSWTVDAAQSFLGYRINEELASIGSTTAVGRTSTIKGALEFDGGAITAVSITADLRDLASDDSRRDGQLRRQALQTNTFPEATFVLAEPISIAGDPSDGGIITATAVGDLTIHGVTNRVEVPIEGKYVDGQVVVVASTVVLLADYDIEKPSAVSVLSVSDEATIELQLVFSKA